MSAEVRNRTSSDLDLWAALDEYAGLSRTTAKGEKNFGPLSAAWAELDSKIAAGEITWLARPSRNGEPRDMRPQTFREYRLASETSVDTVVLTDGHERLYDPRFSRVTSRNIGERILKNRRAQAITLLEPLFDKWAKQLKDRPANSSAPTASWSENKPPSVDDCFDYVERQCGVTRNQFDGKEDKRGAAPIFRYLLKRYGIELVSGVRSNSATRGMRGRLRKVRSDNCR